MSCLLHIELPSEFESFIVILCLCIHGVFLCSIHYSLSDQPISTDDYDVPGLQSHSNADTLDQDVSKQKLTEE
jgi:hypothetical protein